MLKKVIISWKKIIQKVQEANMMDPMSALAMMNPFNSLNPMNFLNPNSNPYLANEF